MCSLNVLPELSLPREGHGALNAVEASVRSNSGGIVHVVNHQFLVLFILVVVVVIVQLDQRKLLFFFLLLLGRLILLLCER